MKPRPYPFSKLAHLVDLEEGEMKEMGRGRDEENGKKKGCRIVRYNGRDD